MAFCTIRTPTQLRWQPERALLQLQPELSQAQLELGRERLEREHGRARRLQLSLFFRLWRKFFFYLANPAAKHFADFI